jgi:predicted protein tyrosine phosphatase
MEQLTPNLYITNAEALLELEGDHEFDEVVSLGHRTHLGLGEKDPSTTGDRFVFPDGPHEYAVFEAAVDYTLDCLEESQTTLVHCQAGVSRSAGVCAAAIATRQGLSADQALRKIEAVRPSVNPTDEVWASVVRYTSGNE